MARVAGPPQAALRYEKLRPSGVGLARVLGLDGASAPFGWK